jgi:hypothetical protein
MTDETPIPVIEGQGQLFVPDAILANAVELDGLRKAIITLKKRENVLRAGLLDYLTETDQEAVIEGDVTISLSKYDREGIDTKKLQAAYPTAHKACATSTPVVQVRVNIEG